jgi:hypothetical protein
VQDDHFHFESVEQEERAPPSEMTREECEAEHEKAVAERLTWIREKENPQSSKQANPWVWSAGDPAEPEQPTKKPQETKSRPKRPARKASSKPEAETVRGLQAGREPPAILGSLEHG